MSHRRAALSVAAGVVVLGSRRILRRRPCRCAAPGPRAHHRPLDRARRRPNGSLTFATDAAASSDVKSRKVPARPVDSELGKKEPAAKEMPESESPTCEPADDDTARCTYTTPVTDVDAAGSPYDTWHIAVLATANNGMTTLHTKEGDLKIGQGWQA